MKLYSIDDGLIDFYGEPDEDSSNLDKLVAMFESYLSRYKPKKPAEFRFLFDEIPNNYQFESRHRGKVSIDSKFNVKILDLPPSSCVRIIKELNLLEGDPISIERDGREIYHRKTSAILNGEMAHLKPNLAFQPVVRFTEAYQLYKAVSSKPTQRITFNAAAKHIRRDRHTVAEVIRLYPKFFKSKDQRRHASCVELHDLTNL